MNAYVTLLERCGHDYYEVEPGVWGQRCDGLMDNPKIFFGDEFKTYALEVGAKEAADDFATWGDECYRDSYWLYIKSNPYRGWGLQRPPEGKGMLGLSNLELIRIATKAGWEKGEGVE